MEGEQDMKKNIVIGSVIAAVFILSIGTAMLINNASRSKAAEISSSEGKSKTVVQETGEKVDVSIGSGEAGEEKEITIPVSFTSIPASGISNCDFKISYDCSMLEAVKVGPGDVFTNPEMNFSYSINEINGTISFLFLDNTFGKEPIKAKGVFANITFKVKKGTPKSETKITLKSIGVFANDANKKHDIEFDEGIVSIK